MLNCHCDSPFLDISTGGRNLLATHADFSLRYTLFEMTANVDSLSKQTIHY